MFKKGMYVNISENYEGLRKGELVLIVSFNPEERYCVVQAKNASNWEVPVQILLPPYEVGKKVAFAGSLGCIEYIDPNDNANKRIRVDFNNGERLWFTIDGKLEEIFDERLVNV